MNSKIWITSLLFGTVIIGGSSASNSGSNEGKTMDHSSMGQKEMSNMEGMDHSNMTREEMTDMENDHASHTNPLSLNNSTGENEIALPPFVEPKDGIVNITVQQGTTEIFKGIETETYGYMVRS